MLLGLHHVTALASEPQRNLDFYTGFLGLRLVKRTVNFDDPSTYHFYFGDSTGTPGTILTFFTWPGAFRGTAGAGQASAVSFAVPRDSLETWMERARTAEIPCTPPKNRFGEEFITIQDADGTNIELVASAPKSDGHAIERLHSVTLRESDVERTATVLHVTLGFRRFGEEGDRVRYEAGNTAVDLIPSPDPSRGKMSAGIVHHIAWRVADDAQQLDWRVKLMTAGLHVSAVRDRQYFRSIYFREPGGVLFEIATDGPGFLIDEKAEALGSSLKLPPWLESIRQSIERRLPIVALNEKEWLAQTR